MEPGNGALNNSTRVGMPSSQHVSGAVATTPSDVSLQPINTPLMQHAIALQQYHFQQSLLNQQLLAQQQAAANAVSIKAAAEEAAARAAQISKLLTGEKPIVEKEIPDEPSLKMKCSESRPRPCSRSISRSSKSKSVSPSRSPSRYRPSRSEHGRYSTRGFSTYRSQRYSWYRNRGYDDHGDYYRSNHRRDLDHHYRDRGSASYYRSRDRSRSRSRGSRSLSRSRTERRLCDRSPSHHHGSYRSPCHKSDQSSEKRLCGISRSPVSSNSVNSSPEQSKSRNKVRTLDNRSFTTQSSGSRPPVGSGSRDDDDISVEKNDVSECTYRRHECDISPRGGKRLSKSGHSSSSLRSGTISTSHSGKKVMEVTKRSPKLARHAPESGKDASFSGSDEEVVSMSLGVSEDENVPLKSDDKYHDHKNNQNHKCSESDKIGGDLGASKSKRDRSPEQFGQSLSSSELLSPRFIKHADNEYTSYGYENEKSVPDRVKENFLIDNVAPERKTKVDETIHRSSHLKSAPDSSQSLKTYNHVMKSVDSQHLVDGGQTYEMKKEDNSFNCHKIGWDKFAGSREGIVDTSPEAGEDMNMNLVPHLTTTEAAYEKESDGLEGVDDDQNVQVATKGHDKRRSKGRSKSGEKRSKHGKKHCKKHKRRDFEANKKKHYEKREGKELKGDKKYHKRHKRERSDGDGKHYRRHRREDSEKTEKKHHRKHRRDDSDEDDFLEKYKIRRLKNQKSHRRDEHGHRERKWRRKHQTTSSFSSSEYSSSSEGMPSDAHTRK